MDEVAQAVGLSRRTLQRARAVVAAVREQPEEYTDLIERMERANSVNGAHQELLRRQGKLPARTRAYFTVRMNANGSVEFSGIKNKQEILTHLHLLIRQIQSSLQETNEAQAERQT